jgi:hypothetical protein
LLLCLRDAKELRLLTFRQLATSQQTIFPLLLLLLLLLLPLLLLQLSRINSDTFHFVGVQLDSLSGGSDVRKPSMTQNNADIITMPVFERSKTTHVWTMKPLIQVCKMFKKYIKHIKASVSLCIYNDMSCIIIVSTLRAVIAQSV